METSGGEVGLGDVRCFSCCQMMHEFFWTHRLCVYVYIRGYSAWVDAGIAGVTRALHHARDCEVNGARKDAALGDAMDSKVETRGGILFG